LVTEKTTKKGGKKSAAVRPGEGENHWLQNKEKRRKRKDDVAVESPVIPEKRGKKRKCGGALPGSPGRRGKGGGVCPPRRFRKKDGPRA